MNEKEAVVALETIIRKLTGSASGSIALLAVDYAQTFPNDVVGILNLNNYVRKEAQDLDTESTAKFLLSHFKKELHSKEAKK